MFLFAQSERCFEHCFCRHYNEFTNVSLHQVISTKPCPTHVICTATNEGNLGAVDAFDKKLMQVYCQMQHHTLSGLATGFGNRFFTDLEDGIFKEMTSGNVLTSKTVLYRVCLYIC